MVVSVSNTNIILLKYLSDVTGIGKIISVARQKANHKDAWNWTLSTAEIKGFLLQIEKYLIIKKEHAELMIMYLERLKSIMVRNYLYQMMNA